MMAVSALLRPATLLLCLAIAAWSGAAYLMPLAQQPVDASAAVFSADRAMAHVAALSAAPRPVASAGHASARAYIVAELRRLGLAPEIQKTVSAFRFPGSEGFGAAKVQNVIARITGTGSDGAVLLNAHYDGANTGPAAGDCAACVAAVLETARALLAGPPLRHDVILVFSDAEEMGDHGAHAFATQHPWMQDVALAVNYEAMGTDGPGSLYVTSANNAALIAALAGAMPHGFGSSVITEVFNAIPDMRNACDLQDYLNYGVAGLGFVLHGQTQNYHTVLDDPSHLNPRSLQSFGDSALGLALAYDDLGPDGVIAAGNAVFFPLAPFGTVIYPASWSLPLAVAAFGIASVLIVISLMRGHVRLLPVVGSGVGIVIAALLATAVCAAIWAGLRAINPNLQVFLIGGYATPWHVAGLTAIAVTVVAFAVGLLRRWFGAPALLAGLVLMLSVLGLGLAPAFPGISYVATLPSLLALPALAATALGRGTRFWGWSGLLSCMAITAFVAPLVLPSGMLMAFVIRLEAMTGLPLLALPAGITALATEFILVVSRVLLPELGARPESGLAGVAALVAVAAFAIGAAQSGFDASHPRPEAVRYELDATTGNAQWATNDPHLGSWSSQFIPPETARLPDGTTAPGGPPTYTFAAPHYDLAAPDVRVIEDSPATAGRDLRLLIASPRAAQIIEVQVQAGSAITAISIGGQSLDLTGYRPATEGKLIFFASDLAANGFELDLTLAAAAPVEISLADMSDGLPGPALLRPADTMPTPGATLDGTVVRSRHAF